MTAEHLNSGLIFDLQSRKDIFEGYSSVFVLTDENTSRYCLPQLNDTLSSVDFHQITIPAGEAQKNLPTVQSICEQLLLAGADRSSLLVNLGGGVVLDTGGFVASVYMRGITFIHVPTTLLAMVDASIGGKTGVDLNGYKNIIGTFCEPKAVIIDQRFLRTLSRRELRNGFAEMIKHGLIADKSMMEKLFSFASDPFGVDQELIRKNIAVKSKIVQQDFRESGIRRLLNFGHTVGHAIEKENIGSMLHGECIAIGMVADLYLSNRLAGMSSQEFTKLSELIRLFYSDVYCNVSPETVLRNCSSDKKSTKGKPTLYLLESAGNPAGVFTPTEEQLTEAVAFALKLFR